MIRILARILDWPLVWERLLVGIVSRGLDRTVRKRLDEILVLDRSSSTLDHRGLVVLAYARGKTDLGDI